MKAIDLQAAVVTLRASLPALDELGTLLNRRDELTAEMAARTASLAALGTQIDASRAQMLQEQQAADAARQKVARDHGVALALVDAKIKDLQRSQQAAEQALAETRAKAGQAVVQQQDAAAGIEAQHRGRVADLLKQEKDAGVRLAAIQGKIKALHGDLAGLSAP